MVKDTKVATVGALLQIDVGNPNAGWTEGIVTVMKKVERPDGTIHPYISGQALRRYLRDTIKDLPEVEEDEISPIQITGEVKAPLVTEGDPEEFLDDDLFGFMKATRKGTRKRASPLRVSPAFALFPYTGDRDLGTKSTVEPIVKMMEEGNLKDVAKKLGVKTKGEEEEIRKAIIEEAQGGSMFETELTSNIYRTSWLLELDRLGKWGPSESPGAESGELPLKERQRRASLVFKGLKYLWGGGRKTRLMVDLTP
ncbi:MAG: type I-B CRISPR-associated protein Cas7/Cst2/DevR, partial [Thermoproteota archaeon]